MIFAVMYIGDNMVTVAKNWHRKIYSLCLNPNKIMLNGKEHIFENDFHAFVLDSLGIDIVDEDSIYLIRCGVDIQSTARSVKNKLTYDKRNGNCVLRVGNDRYTWHKKINW